MGKKVNQTELAEILGVTDVTIWEWQKQGLPIEAQTARGEANRYDTAAVINWRVAREIAKACTETQRDRLARLQADRIEIELEKERRTIVSTAEIEPTWTQRVLTAAAYMASRQSRLAGLLEATPGVEAKRNLLKQEDAGFLSRLGVDGERMQKDLEDVLTKISDAEAQAFLKRISGDDKQDSDSGAQSRVDEVRPGAEDPALGVG
jgi:DNA-binding transcriptional MerR regulator